MKINKILFTAFLLGISMSVFSQTVGEQGRTTNYTIKGVVEDEQSGNGVPYATVSLQKDSVAANFLKRVAADDNGKFEIELPLDSGTYFIHIEAVGYNTILQPIELADNKKVDAGKFLMKEGTELTGVQVVATKPLVTQDLDKIGYDVEADPESATNNALEMLRKVPLVTVDGEDNIQIKGSSSFKIYLNGKPSNMITKNPKDVLKSMPASSIKKIEVITDPGAKYDAEGVTAILNIITQSTLQGFQGSINAGVNTLGRFNAGGNIQAKVGKFGITANYNYQQYGSPSWSESSNENFGAGMPYKFSNSSSQSRYSGGYHWGNIELSYEFDTLNLLSASFGVYGGQWKSKGINNEPFYTSQTYMRNELGDTIVAYKSLGNSLNSYMNYSGNVDYQRTFKKPEQLLTISYLFDLSPNNSESISIVENDTLLPTSPASPKDMNMKFISLGRSDEHTFQIDYTEPFKDKKHTIEVGLKYILRYNGSDNDYKLYNEIMEKYDLDTNLIKNNMDYYQHIFSAYASYTFKLKKFSVRVGGRLEGTFRDIRYIDVPSMSFKDKKPIIDIIPSISLNYKPTDKSNFRFSYNNGISRPSIWYLNPYIDDSNPYYISYGNPNLQSERSHRFSLSYGYVAKKINMNISAYSSFINNSIESVHKLQDYNGKEGVLISTYENIGHYASVGGSFYINYNPLKWLRFWVQGSGSYSEFRDNNAKPLPTYRINGYGGFNFTLPWKLKFNIGGGGSTPWVGYKYSGTAWYYYYASLSRSFLKGDKLTVSISTQNPFEKYRTYKSKTWEEGIFERNSTSKQLSRQFGISISWRFGEMKAQIKKAERGIANDDVKSGGGGSGGGQGGGGN